MYVCMYVMSLVPQLFSLEPVGEGVDNDRTEAMRHPFLLYRIGIVAMERGREGGMVIHCEVIRHIGKIQDNKASKQ